MSGVLLIAAVGLGGYWLYTNRKQANVYWDKFLPPLPPKYVAEEGGIGSEAVVTPPFPPNPDAEAKPNPNDVDLVISNPVVKPPFHETNPIQPVQDTADQGGGWRLNPTF
jgi:hypothetical protein